MNPLFLHEVETEDMSEERLWESYHENSKLSKYTANFPSQRVISSTMKQIYESLPFDGYEKFQLEDVRDCESSELLKAIGDRRSANDFGGGAISLRALSIILQFGYGITDSSQDQDKPSFRASPSGGALYPLDIYLYISNVEGLEQGIYHYYVVEHQLSLLKKGNFDQDLGEINVYENAWLNASVILFITAFFERTTFKYGERGYRFCLLEAGHVAQNFNLLATSLDLGILNVGGFYDRKADTLLGMDGMKQSTLYLTSIGTK